MSEQIEEQTGPQCYLVTIEVDHEEPDIVRGFGCPDAAEAFRTELEAYQQAKPAWPADAFPLREWVRAEEAREAWLDAHPGGRRASGADRFGIIAAPFVAAAPGQGKVKRTYLISYSFPGGGGRNFHHRDTDDAPTMENIESMEKKIAENNNLSSVTIMSISRIGNSA